jgi:2-hydroxychromene-2-carboxylate isomerase
MRTIDWYIDNISPFPYIALSRFQHLPADVTVQPVPIVFSALLSHHGHKGPAEIEEKRIQTFRMAIWTAAQRGIPFAVPDVHPFNPIALSRLTIAAGSTLDAVRIAATHVWGEGNDGADPASLSALAEKLGVEDWQARVADQAVKDELRANTDAAIARGVYGVPTFDAAGELFWGDDVMPMMLDYLENPDLFA